MDVARHFAETYAEAREKFTAAARARGLEIERAIHPGQPGPDGEPLSIDSALFAPEGARSVLVVTSGTHGVEGFCGSGCQVGLLGDDLLFTKLTEARVALLLVHAVNPYGFAHLRRVNEDNVDLNRNSADFAAAAASNPAYLEVDPLLLPATWPPGPADQAALNQFIATRGMQALRDAMTGGQYRVPDGMFYGGSAPCWSTRQMGELLARHLPRFAAMVWIDVHTGLGPYGHGEKIFVGSDAAELARANATWGADVLPITAPGSVSSVVEGALVNLAYTQYPGIEKTIMALEFGTLDSMQVMQALRADHWMHRHPDVPADTRAEIRQGLRDAFYCDSPDWKGQVYGQTRVAVLQSVAALARHARA